MWATTHITHTHNTTTTFGLAKLGPGQTWSGQTWIWPNLVWPNLDLAKLGHRAQTSPVPHLCFAIMHADARMAPELLLQQCTDWCHSVWGELHVDVIQKRRLLPDLCCGSPLHRPPTNTSTVSHKIGARMGLKPETQCSP